MNIDRALIIAAHPDDEILGCGGFILKHFNQGASVKVLFLGEGSTCRYNDPDSIEARQAIRLRNLWAAEALKVIGISDYEFFNLPCGRFDQVPIIKLNKIIESVIKVFKPDTVLTHSDVDTNNDHRITHRATIMATRPCNDWIVKRLLCYEVLSSSEWSYASAFIPNYFVSLTKEQLLAKWRALECYQTEMRDYPFPRSWEGVKNLAMMRGMQAGFKFSEAFQLIREFDQ